MTNQERRIYINNDLDIVTARMQAREFAKNMGFGTADRARISLATSELARVISWNTDTPGEIVMSDTSKNGHQGLKVMCTIQVKYLSPELRASESTMISAPCQSLSGARQLVDESIIEQKSNEHALITLIQWMH